ncbi:MAG: actin-binding WH2 domain-containing protein [Chloroflexi bacterium]|nr:MAG: actin-binding WH2 domain-containing protein [Chloroflexota bacterium]MBL1194272.1 actin-binding WH2 domain-containing protein [Chloroflexota bacterium]NOH11562.1 actin-binding WH2 domain-containing protein [Chloroflexota bacterium]
MEIFTIAESILRDRNTFFTEIRDNKDVGNKIKRMLISCFVFFAIYGAVMGASHGVLQTFSSTIKLPLLFLATLAICTPSLHFFYILFGARQTLAQMVSLLLATISVTAVLLLSMAPITFFFLITGSSYDFFKLLNVVFFALAGVLGVVFLRQGIVIATEGDGLKGTKRRHTIFFTWVLLYGFVGSQMAWTLSPFMGRPDLPFMVIFQGEGNFFVDVLRSLGDLLLNRFLY